jgi:hypothetical protein
MNDTNYENREVSVIRSAPLSRARQALDLKERVPSLTPKQCVEWVLQTREDEISRVEDLQNIRGIPYEVLQRGITQYSIKLCTEYIHLPSWTSSTEGYGSIHKEGKARIRTKYRDFQNPYPYLENLTTTDETIGDAHKDILRLHLAKAHPREQRGHFRPEDISSIALHFSNPIIPGPEEIDFRFVIQNEYYYPCGTRFMDRFSTHDEYKDSTRVEDIGKEPEEDLEKVRNLWTGVRFLAANLLHWKEEGIIFPNDLDSFAKTYQPKTPFLEPGK